MSEFANWLCASMDSVHPSRVGKQHEGLLTLTRWRWIDDGLGRAIVVVDLYEIARVYLQFCHILRVHLDAGVGPAVSDEFVLLIEVGALPDMVRPT
jgi:hypothetical protein